MRSHLLFLSTVSLIALMPLKGFAEDCTGVLPGANCTLDESTTADLTIDDGFTLTIGGSVDVNHTIDSSDSAFGTIVASPGVVINQNAAIGTIDVIDSLSLDDGTVFNVNSSLLTDQSGGDAGGGVEGDIDLDLDNSGVGGTLALGDGAVVRAQIVGSGTVTSTGVVSVRGTMNNLALDVQSGSFSMVGPSGQDVALTQFDVQSGARANLSGGATSVQLLNLDGELALASDASLSVVTYNSDANGGRIELGLNRDAGVLAAPTITFVAGGPVDLSGSEFEFVIDRGSEVLVTETFDNFIIGNVNTTISPTVLDQSFLYDFLLVPDGNNVDLSIVRGDVTGSATTSNNAAVASEFLILLPSDVDFVAGSGVSDVQKALSDASTKTEYNEILESILPSLDAAPRAAARYVSKRTMDIASKRILHLRQPARRVPVSQIEPAAGPGNGTAYNAGASFTEGGRVWGTTFVSTAKQGDRGGVDGYDLDAYGVVVGADTGRLNDDWVIGVAATYGASQIQSQNANSAKTDVASYQLTGYGTYNTSNDYFINGAVSWGVHDIVAERNDVGSIGARARAEYDGEQINVHSEIGADYKKGGMVVTPSFSADYMYYNAENYRERDAGDLNLIVSEDSFHSLHIGPKIAAQWLNQLNDNLRFIPEISAAYSYDVIGDDLVSSAALAGGNGGALSLNGFESQNHEVNIGLAASLVGHKWDTKALYDYEWSGDLSSHAFVLQGIYKF